MEDCILEANFEFVEQPPITLDLEVKQYFDGAGQVIKEFIFEETDWQLYEGTEDYYHITYNRVIHSLEDLTVTAIFLWDSATETFRPALCDYTIETVFDEYEVLVDTVITLFSEIPCKGKLVVFGQIITEA